MSLIIKSEISILTSHMGNIVMLNKIVNTDLFKTMIVLSDGILILLAIVVQ